MPRPKSLTQQQQLMTTVDFHWLRPDEPPPGMFRPPDPTEPFVTYELFAVPQYYELVTLPLPYPEISIPLVFEPLPVRVHGRVVLVTMDPVRHHAKVILERAGRVGMTWGELCACIGATMVAFLPPFGRVEGTLQGLSPRWELAVLKVPGSKDIQERYLQMLEEQGEDISEYRVSSDDEEENQEEDSDILWVPWSSLWTRAGIEAMGDLAMQQLTPVPGKRKVTRRRPS